MNYAEGKRENVESRLDGWMDGWMDGETKLVVESKEHLTYVQNLK